MPLADKYIKFDKLSSSTIFNSTTPINPDDPISDQVLYHEGYDLITDEIKFFDENNVQVTVTDLQSVSGIRKIGILEHDIINETVSLGPPQPVDYYYWDEIYTTPIGVLNILQAKNNSISLSASSVNQQMHRIYDTVYGPSDRIIIKLKDVNITPRVNNYLVFQKYYQDAFNSNEPVFQKVPNNDPTTDDLNNLPLHRISELFVFQIKQVNLIDINTGNDPNLQGSVYEIFLDKSFKIPDDDLANPDTLYMSVLLNRFNEDTKEGLLKSTWQRYEVHNNQLLGDPYDFTGLTEPKGRTNFLKYKNSGNLGVVNLLSEIIKDDIKTEYFNLLKSPITILDFDDELKDRIYYTSGGVEVHLPGILLQENTFDFSSPLNTNPPYIIPPVKLINSTKKTQIGVGDYSELLFRNKKYGYVFYDLRIVVITDGELCMALSYNSNRNYTLPNLTFLNLTSKNVNPNLNKNAEYTHFISYKVRSKHYDETLPFSKFESFNWISGLSIPNRGSGLSQYQIDLNNSAINIKISDFITYLKDSNNHFGFEADEVEIIIGEYDISYISTVDPTVDKISIKGIKNVKVVGVLQYGSISSNTYSLKYTSGLNIGEQKATHDEIRINYIDWVNSPEYNLDGKMYTTADSNVSETTYFSGLNPWLIGIIKYQEEAKKFRMTIEYNLKADKFNGTTNPTYEVGNELMKDKLISEIGLVLGEYIVDDETLENLDIQVYGKISPPIKKLSSQDTLIRISLDF